MRFYDQPIFAQFWAPIYFKSGIVLTTCGQPFAVSLNTDDFWSYHVACFGHNAYVDPNKGVCIGLPGRIFLSMSPEWTQDVRTYNDKEYPQLQDAKNSNIRGSFFMPVIEGGQCVGILEFATTNLKEIFAYEIGEVCRALEEVGLKSSEVRNENINFDTSEANSPMLQSHGTSKKRRISKSHKITRNDITKLFGLPKADATKICRLWYNFNKLSENTFTVAHCNYGVKEWPCIRSEIVKSSAHKALIEHAKAFLNSSDNVAPRIDLINSRIMQDSGDITCEGSFVDNHMDDRLISKEGERVREQLDETNKNSCLGYTYFDPTMLDDFVAMKSTEDAWILETQTQHSEQCTHMRDVGQSVEPYIPKVQPQSEFPIKLGTNDLFINTRMNVFEENQTQHVEQQMVTMPVAQMSQSRQRKRKLARAKQSNAKGKEKLREDKMTDNKKQAEKVKQHLMKIILRPDWHRKMASRLQDHIRGDWTTWIRFSLDEKMFTPHVSTYVHIDAEALLTLFVNRWVDSTVVYLATSYFYKKFNAKEHNRCAFFNVANITGDRCQTRCKEVEEHICTLVAYHHDKEYFFAPYLADNHWSLFIIAPRKRQAYILDSLSISSQNQKDPSCYLLTNAIRNALSSIDINFTMVKCKQQKSGWECGYMIFQYMLDYVTLYQDQFPLQMWNDTSVATDEDIDNLLKKLIPVFFRELNIPG